MIWIAGTALAFVFVKLGGFLVLMKLLVIGLVLSLLTNVALAFTLIWRKGIVRKLFVRGPITDKT
jgi:hypothetical protein